MSRTRKDLKYSAIKGILRKRGKSPDDTKVTRILFAWEVVRVFPKACPKLIVEAVDESTGMKDTVITKVVSTQEASDLVNKAIGDVTVWQAHDMFGLPRIRQRIVQYIDYAGETRYKAYPQTVETLVVVRKYAYERKFLDWQKLVDEEELLRSQLPKSVEDNILPRKKYHWMSKTEGGLKHSDYRRAYIDDEDKDEISSYNPVNRKNYPAKEGVYAW